MPEIIIDEKTENIIREAEKLGITDYYAVRNLRIKSKYYQLKASGLKYEDVLMKLAKEFSRSYETIQNIIMNSYKPKNKNRKS